jgi:glycosyltransferase involved in cell wall biosynthesis
LRAALTRLRVPAIAFALGEQAPVERLGSVELRSQPFLEPAQVADYLRASDVYVLPTRADNHPLTSLEALASGTPVVASRVGGLPEQVTAETGVLVEPGDPAGLAQALEELLRDPERRARMGAAAVGDARASFSIDRQADAYVDLYREVVQVS